MKVIETSLHIGLDAPVSLLHISDTHLTYADDRDDKRKIDLAAGRAPCFPHAAEELAAECAYAGEQGILILHTGDLIDFVSAANLDAAKRFMDENDVLFIAGNHEFSLYVGEAFEDEAYRNQSLARVQTAFPENIRFTSRVLGGVNFVGIDNGYYRFDRAQLDALKAEVAKGLPVILYMHNPLHEPELYRLAMSCNPCAYLTGTPEELMQTYDDYRYRQQKADADTWAAIEYIESCPAIKAIFAGHLHHDYDGAVAAHLPQYVTGIGTARRVTID